MEIAKGTTYLWNALRRKVLNPFVRQEAQWLHLDKIADVAKKIYRTSNASVEDEPCMDRPSEFSQTTNDIYAQVTASTRGQQYVKAEKRRYNPETRWA